MFSALSEMSRLRLLVGMIPVLLVGQAQSLMAQEALGGVRGSVVDTDFGQPLANVRVVITELGRSAVTDSSGNFNITGVAPGVYSISASKTDFLRPTAVQVAVRAGGFVDVDLKLQSSETTLPEMELDEDDFLASPTVDAGPGANKADAIVEMFSQKLIAQYGARDAGAALSRMVGTNIVDGKYVVVRGLADRYVNVLLNGSRVPSADPDKRAVQVDVFPGNLLGGIATSKTFTPDQPGDSTGGTVNIRTKSMPAKFTFGMSGTLEYNTQASLNDRFLRYEGGGAGPWGKDDGRRQLPAALRGYALGTSPNTLEQAKEADRATRSATPVLGTFLGNAPFNYSGSITLGDQFRFLGAPAGYLASLSYQRRYQLWDFHRGRYTLPDAGNQELEGDLSVGTRGAEEAAVGFLFNAGIRPAEDNEISVNILINQNGQDETVLTEQIETSNPAQRTVLHFTERTLQAVQFRGDHRLVNMSDATVEWAFTAARAQQSEPDYRRFDNSYDYATGLQQGLGTFIARRFWRDLDDRSYSGKLDIKIPLFGEGRDAENFLKLGAAFDLYQRDYTQDTFGYVFGGAQQEQADFISQTERFADRFFDGNRVGLVQDTQPFLNYYLRSLNTEGRSYTARQTIPAAYLMFDLKPSDSVRVNVGVRAEQTDLQLRASGEPLTLIGTNVADIRRLDILPALSASYDMREDMKLRFAYGRTMARPSFKELAPLITDEFAANEVFIGNPRLQLSSADNLDLRWEWVPGAGEIMAIGAFYKRIEDPIERSSFLNPETGLITIQKRNFERAQVYGVEFEYRKELDDFAPWLEHFTFNFNASYIKSQVPLSPELLAVRRSYGIDETNRRLEGQPDYTVNAGLTWEDPDLGLNAGVFYNVTGPYLYTVGEGGTPDVFEQPAPSLDLALGYKLSDRSKVTLRAKNLLDPTYERTYVFGNREYIYQSYRRGTDYSLTFSFDW